MFSQQGMRQIALGLIQVEFGELLMHSDAEPKLHLNQWEPTLSKQKCIFTGLIGKLYFIAGFF